MVTIRKSIYFSAIGHYAGQLLSFFLIIITSRLLTPAEVGVFSLSMSFYLLFNEFKQFGGGILIVREADLTKSLLSSIATVMILLSWTIAFLIILFRVNIADYFGVIEVADVLLILALTLIVSPFSSVIYSLNTREMKFDKLLHVQLVSQLMVFIVTIVLIYFEYSFYALALGVLAGAIVEFVVLLALNKFSFPSVPRTKDASLIFRFGLKTSLISFLNRSYKSLPELFIGRASQVEQVGYYSRSQGLVTFLEEAVLQSIRPVVMPTLSKSLNEGKNLLIPYLNSSCLLVAFVLPIFIVISIYSEDLVLVLFGHQWQFIHSAASMLAIAAAVKSFHSFSSQLLMVTKRENALMIKQIINVIFLAALLISFDLSNIVSVALCVVIVSILDFVITHFLLKHAIGLSFSHFLNSHSKNLTLVLITVVWALVLKFVIVDRYMLSEFLTIWLIAFTEIIVWLVAVFSLKHPISAEISIIFKHLREKIRWI